MSIIERITDYSSAGEGICRHEGMVFFVLEALVGELVEIDIISTGRSFGRANIKRIIEPSPQRCIPSCEIFGSCGGCDLMHMSYQEQLRFKKGRIKNAMDRIGGLSCSVNDVTASKSQYGYRNKARYSIQKGIIGFNRKSSNEVIETNSCHIVPEDVEQLKNKLKSFIRHYPGILTITIRKSIYNSELAVILESEKKNISNINALAKKIKESSDKIVSIDIITGNNVINLFGKGFIEDKVGKYHFIIKPRSFFQINTPQAEKLYKTALRLSGTNMNETLLDPYCGTGTIALYFSDHYKKVIGSDVEVQSIEAAKENTVRNQVKNANFFCCKAEELLKSNSSKDTTVILDPPRNGCDPNVLEAITSIGFQKIIYISCEPSTLARDLKYLAAKNYRFSEIQPLDMFPQTSHVEAIIMMTKCGLEDEK